MGSHPTEGWWAYGRAFTRGCDDVASTGIQSETHRMSGTMGAVAVIGGGLAAGPVGAGAGAAAAGVDALLDEDEPNPKCFTVGRQP